MKKTGTYGIMDLCDATGATPRQIDHWVRTNVLIPQYRATGSGDRHVFSEENIKQVSLLVRFSKVITGIHESYQAIANARIGSRKRVTIRLSDDVQIIIENPKDVDT